MGHGPNGNRVHNGAGSDRLRFEVGGLTRGGGGRTRRGFRGGFVTAAQMEDPNMRRTLPLGTAFLLALAGCGGGGEAPANQAANEAVATNESANAAAAEKPQLAACPFRETRQWAGSIEGGRLLVTGLVDLQMAGFKPALTIRSSSPPTVALDLALAPEAGAVVTEEARYEAASPAPYRNGEIWCGGERIASFDIVVVG